MDAGKLQIYKLTNIADRGDKPTEKLVYITDAYYSEKTIGINRHYTALSVNQHIDRLVRCYNVTIPDDAEYVILEDKKQYRISFKQKIGDMWDLTLERLGEKLDVIPE